ncbi:type III-A CRISPR-associated protein Cas10/Csm1 [Geminocystis herdmanii]|uniref:type III-A CRISPR-associated protein Cas10/Csm1 n=1 Tax=Geminocystis herdmanii TaxID=669359 RepID=UPI00034D832B|nr:type III-A CRISPR-associated protein Cas10/Csm1 [Geminocystis herdmanii]
MNNTEVTNHQIALSVLQEGIKKLAQWLELDFPSLPLIQHQSIIKAKEIISWKEESEFKPLNLLFDSIHIQNYKSQEKTHYSPSIVLKNSFPILPSPVLNIPEMADFKTQVKEIISNFNHEDLSNLSLLNLCLEKIGSHISYGENDIAYSDFIKSLAMIAVSLNNNPSADNIGLIGGDLSGIQNFIYTISADGALKSLRARSFFLELVTAEITQQLLTELNLPPTNIIYAGGGNLYILTNDNHEENQRISNVIKARFNDWFSKSYQGKMFLALDYVTLPVDSLSSDQLSQYWQKIPQKLGSQKQQKFSNQIRDFLAPKPSYESCQVCHRDDQVKLKPLNPHNLDSSSACWVCRTMFELGSRLFKVKAIVRVKRAKNRTFDRTERVNKIVLPGYEYYLYESINKALSVDNAETIFLINNWDLANYKEEKIKPILLGNYGKKTELENESGFMSASEMTEIARKSGKIARVAYLRMDVDNLGKIFAQGLAEKLNLPRLASLSRQMTYFFKVYLNTLATEKNYNLLFIYAGGDDLFISGVWDEVIDFAFQIYESFREYTGYNSSVTLSAGISFAGAKYPLYQSANESGEAEEKAKGNGRDSLGLFGEVFKWEEWLGKENINVNQLEIDDNLREYLGGNVSLSLFGVKPFVDALQNIKDSYSRNFVQNLLATAKIQEQKIKEVEKKKATLTYPQEIDDVKYFLHLPKIAYTLARLPSHIQNNPQFEPIKSSLKSPYNARYYSAIATWLELLNRSS